MFQQLECVQWIDSCAAWVNSTIFGWKFQLNFILCYWESLSVWLFVAYHVVLRYVAYSSRIVCCLSQFDYFWLKVSVNLYFVLLGIIVSLAVCGISCCVAIRCLQQLELPNEVSQPGSSLSLRVPPAPSTSAATTLTSRTTNENSDRVNNNVMSHSVTNSQTPTSRVHRSSSTTNPQKPGLFRAAGSCVCGNFVRAVFWEWPNFCILLVFTISQCIRFCSSSFSFMCFFVSGHLWIYQCMSELCTV